MGPYAYLLTFMNLFTLRRTTTGKQSVSMRSHIHMNADKHTNDTMLGFCWVVWVVFFFFPSDLH